MAEKQIIDHAATKPEAIELRDLYVAIAAAEGIEGWLFGYEKDPVASPDGRHGWQVYAVQTE